MHEHEREFVRLQTKLRRIFQASLHDFLERDVDNVLNGVAERNLCQRLSMPLERHALAAGLSDYRADVEFNRSNDGKLKTIAGENMETVTITCDLILHSRGLNPDRDNLIAIEMKRRSHPAREKHKDRVRLMALTREPFEGVWSADGQADPQHVCDYVLGYFLELDGTARTLLVEEYIRGSVSGKRVEHF